MARIFYGVSGEGRGHATRVSAMVERLRADHEITLFAYGDAYHFLAPLYRRTEVKVRPIRGMRFRYRGLRVDYARTGLAGARFGTRVLPGLVSILEERLRRERPDLVITDFEPALPRAAARRGIPFVSLSHQHVLVVGDLSALPFRLRWVGDLLGLIVRAYYRGQARTIVSSFFAPPLKPSYRGRAVQVGVLLRPEVLAAKPERRGHIAVYLRRFAPAGLIRSLSQCGIPARVYGLGELSPAGCVSFHSVSAKGFLEDLATCEALVCTAGNQLVGEALYLGKPVLAVPEPGNWEQRINAHFLRQGGWGDSVGAEDVGGAFLRKFVGALDSFRARIVPESVQGNESAYRALQPFLGQRAAAGGTA